MGVNLRATSVVTYAGDVRSERIDIDDYADGFLGVHDVRCGTDHGLAIPFDIPCQAKARSEILVVALVQRRKRSPRLYHGRSRSWVDVGVEVPNVVAPLRRRRVVLIAKTQVKREPWNHAPIVLNEAGIRVFTRYRRSIPNRNVAVFHVTQQEVLQARECNCTESLAKWVIVPNLV